MTKDFKKDMIKCSKCGKWSRKQIVDVFGTCLCGEVLDPKAKFRYDMKQKLRLWRKSNF